VYAKLEEYHELMEQVKIKEGLKTCMALSSICNLYVQNNKPWDLAKKEPLRCAQVVRAGLNALRLLTVMLEPFIPSFSAKVYEQMKFINDKGELLNKQEEQLLQWVWGHPERLTDLVPAGH
jgi:methionyl-tRNA synthetase